MKKSILIFAGLTFMIPNIASASCLDALDNALASGLNVIFGNTIPKDSMAATAKIYNSIFEIDNRLRAAFRSSCQSSTEISGFSRYSPTVQIGDISFQYDLDLNKLRTTAIQQNVSVLAPRNYTFAGRSNTPIRLQKGVGEAQARCIAHLYLYTSTGWEYTCGNVRYNVAFGGTGKDDVLTCTSPDALSSVEMGFDSLEEKNDRSADYIKGLNIVMTHSKLSNEEFRNLMRQFNCPDVIGL
jgi:hypothetical protein